jgi:hypothetical protein
MSCDLDNLFNQREIRRSYARVTAFSAPAMRLNVPLANYLSAQNAAVEREASSLRAVLWFAHLRVTP